MFRINYNDFVKIILDSTNKEYINKKNRIFRKEI